MTVPGQGGQWPPPDAHQPPGYYPQGTPAQPGSPYQPYPAQYQQPGYYQPQPQTAEFPAPPPQQGNGKRGLIIGLVVALVALLGGGATWFALSQGDSVAAGAPTPTAAAEKLAGAFGDGDVVGLLSTLAPAEAALFTDPIEEATAELKRLQILRPDANSQALRGVSVRTENLTFDEAAAQRVNDHLTITKLTGGTLTITADPSQIPLAKDFLDATGLPARPGPETETIDIGKVVAEQGEPIRIATVNVDDGWYPSMLYTIADYALLEAGQRWPAEPVPANGAASPNEAVKQLVQAALNADVRRVIELLPPDEMGALHDAGPALLAAIGDEAEPSGAELVDLRTQTSQVPGGTRVTLASLELRTPNGRTVSVRKEGTCYLASSAGRSQRLCAEDLAEEMADETDSSLPREAEQALRNMAGGILEQGVGVITTQVGGKHYVSPIRTLVEQGMTVLRSLRAEDIKAMLGG